MPADNSCISISGPWQHRFVQANGAQFHIAHAGTYSDTRPLVLLVHGFPQYWWAWREQIAPLAAAGFEVAAIDKRGFGGSDKTPNSADALLLTDDLISLVHSLGYDRAFLVGLGRGGALAWSAVSKAPDLFAGLVTVSSPHPRTLHRLGMHLTLRTWRHAISSFLTPLAEKKLQDSRHIAQLLQEWSAPGNNGAAGQADLYTQALRLPGVAKAALAQLRWTLLSQHSARGRQYLRESANPVKVPILAVRGALDPLLPPRAWNKDAEFARGSYELLTIAQAGHFVPEEQPAAFTDALRIFLQTHC